MTFLAWPVAQYREYLRSDSYIDTGQPINPMKRSHGTYHGKRPKVGERIGPLYYKHPKKGDLSIVVHAHAAAHMRLQRQVRELRGIIHGMQYRAARMSFKARQFRERKDMSERMNRQSERIQAEIAVAENAANAVRMGEVNGPAVQAAVEEALAKFREQYMSHDEEMATPAQPTRADRKRDREGDDEEGGGPKRALFAG